MYACLYVCLAIRIHYYWDINKAVIETYSTMSRPLSPCSVQFFSVNVRSMACESALTNLLIARTRLMHRNKYETNYASNVPYIENTTQ